MIPLEEKQKKIISIISKYNEKSKDKFILNEEKSIREPESNVWLIVVNNQEDKEYFFIVEWEIKGTFLRRNCKKILSDDQKKTQIIKMPDNIAEVSIDDHLRVVKFRLINRWYILFNLKGEITLKTDIYPKVIEQLNFLEEIATMYEHGIC